MDYRKLSAIAAVSMALLILIYVCFSVVNQRADAWQESGVTTEVALYGEVSD